MKLITKIIILGVSILAAAQVFAASKPGKSGNGPRDTIAGPKGPGV